ncbi:MAG: hypothetical protein JO366_20190 [Methylobacteriaceae bacterium]|nr:hypothetical protein [Methylobacteriaceae bacterium]MBV9221200.1 hypothetical protein [Methylobacteriaceae bacterium]MBV9247125.1 hypothetical protein [Methylobacteriaceae bacterium]MBV9705647.1 hypothetical protein [Methylobacteriaceae bacterium]
MSEAYIIEVAGHTAGIVVRDAGQRLFSFHAAKRVFGALEGLAVASPRDAERAVRRHLKRRTRPHAPALVPSPR